MDVRNGTVRLELPGRVPPSFNVVGARGGRAAFHRFKKLYQELFEQQLLAEQARGTLPKRVDEVVARGLLVFTVRRDRDEGNFRALIEKALGDALRGDRRVWPEGRWLEEDTPEHYRFERLHLHPEPLAEAKTVVEFEWYLRRLF